MAAVQPRQTTDETERMGYETGRKPAGAPSRTETPRDSVLDGVGAIYLYTLKLQIIHSFTSCIILQFTNKSITIDLNNII